ncbi:ubiquinone-binding protein [Pacificimonas flava]|uniref:Ubiquinone-binding protein n=2 Tax=Pacificimonas TaxID=1960290 RepID=A0A219B851_9SPHN|nr:MULTISPECIES: type II toxin-antitoxin system RatA family toxin [Pacificimonas]MBZ6378812.1 type II toxin-antitoxin system RatA family toxin [Pacificimonas aurantium]OWV33928.1 ubiquinone-binding protein [Pacificimonas flava]
MPRHKEVRHLPYSPTQMFDLVADVGGYEEFLPWVVATRVRSRSETELVADLMVGFRMVRETFTSKVALDRPHHIHVDYLDGPLRYLKNDWRFDVADDGGTDICFFVDFEFKQKLFERLAGSFFHEAFRRMVAAFEKRARDVYGAPEAQSDSGSSSSSAHSTA